MYTCTSPRTSAVMYIRVRGIDVLKCIHVPALERERSCIFVVGYRCIEVYTCTSRRTCTVMYICGRGISVLKCIHVPALERERSCIFVVGARSCIFVVGVSVY